MLLLTAQMVIHLALQFLWMVFRSLRMLRSDCPRTAASRVVLYSRKGEEIQNFLMFLA